MKKALKSIFTTLYFIGIPVSFVYGLTLDFLSLIEMNNAHVNAEFEKAFAQVIQGFVFAIGYLIVALMVGVILWFFSKPPQEDTEDTEKSQPTE